MTAADWHDAGGFEFRLGPVVLRVDRGTRRVALLHVTGVESQGHLYRGRDAA